MSVEEILKIVKAFFEALLGIINALKKSMGNGESAGE